jgi:hypothetical protein
MAEAGIVRTDAIERTPKVAASQKTAVRPELPAKPPREGGACGIARVIERLVPAVLSGEAGLSNHPEGDSGDGRADRGPGDRGRDLRGSDDPEPLGQEDDRRSEDGENPRNDDVRAFARGGVDERAGRRGHDHPGHSTQWNPPPRGGDVG